ncbi:MAG: hypothetical protein JNK78_06250 [Planctomycetes bacterium]|nr:hypothetical protein [Planctomycetota bacterium]
MSSKHRHGLPKKRPDPKAKAEIEADLPTLEPVEEDLPTLEPVDEAEVATPEVEDGPVKVTTSASDEAVFDLVLAVDVPAMDKKAVTDAVAGPLARAAKAADARIRHKRVLVRFTGEAVIGSAVKQLVGTTLEAHKPLKATVRRGFGDETVIEGALPKVQVASSEHGGATRVEVATADLDPRDLAMAFQPHLDSLAATAKGRKFVLQFSGSAKPDSALRAKIADALQAAGAMRAAIGERVLFDREMADRVRVTAANDVVTIDVKPADDEMATVDAISTVVPQHSASMQGKVVRLRFAQPGRAAEIAACVDASKKGGPARIELAGPNGGEILWPKLLTATQGAELTLRVVPNERDRVTVMAAFRRECLEHASAAKGGAVVVDWPAGFVLDAEVEEALQAAARALAPKSLACTVAGEHREPFFPDVVLLVAEGAGHTFRIRSDAGKPVEVQRAIDRRIATAAAAMRGKAVRVQVTGGVALSRTLLKSVCTAIEGAGASRLEIEDGATVDVLVPPMLRVTKGAPNELRIAGEAGGRDAAQQALALKREIETAGVTAGSAVCVAEGPLAESIVAAVIARSAGSVVIDGPAPIQVHPPLFGAPEKKGAAVRLVVNPGGDAAMVARQVDRELQGALGRLGVLGTAGVTVVWPGATAAHEGFVRVLKGLLAKKAAKVFLDSGDGKVVQVHPATVSPFAPPPPTPVSIQRPAASARAAIAPAAPLAPVSVEGAPAAPAPTFVPDGITRISLLARKDDAMPPMVLLGVADGADAAHVAAVEHELTGQLPRLRGRCVLFVLRAGDQDVPVRRDGPLVAVLRRLASKAAAATLVFRGPDAKDRPHFQVLHSTVRAYPPGAAFADPRGVRVPATPPSGESS